MKSVLVISAGFIHPPFLGRLALRQVLNSEPGFSFHYRSSLENLPDDLSDYTALILYIHQSTISPAALDALDQFVSNGGGLLALHSATASFKETFHYFKILGGRFIGHGPVESFRIQRQAGSLVFDDIPDFTVFDELYLHELEPDIEVHFYSQYQGKPVPIVWTRNWGAGKVFYAVPGHTSASMRCKPFQKIIRRGLQWVSG